MSHEHEWGHKDSDVFQTCETCGVQLARSHISTSSQFSQWTPYYTGDHVKFRGTPPGSVAQPLTGTITNFFTRLLKLGRHESHQRQVISAMIDSVNGKGVFEVRLGRFEHVSAVDALGALVDPEV